MYDFNSLCTISLLFEYNKILKKKKNCLTLNRISVHMALPWVMIGSSSSPLPSQQSSSTHLLILKVKELLLY